MIPDKHALERGTGRGVQPFDLDSCDAWELLQLQERPRLGKSVEGLVRDGNRHTSELSHSSANPPGLKDRDPMPDQERAGRLVRRMKEHRPQVVILGLKTANHRIAAADLLESPAVDVQ